MLQIRRILVATDFSECANRALEFACELAVRFGAELRLVHVQKDAIPYHGYEFDCLEEVQQRLDAMPGPPWSDQLTVTRTVRVGPPSLEIVTEAQDSEADMIVVGSHGRGAVKHLILGSVAERVIRSAPCPVLTVRHDAPFLAEGPSDAVDSPTAN